MAYEKQISTIGYFLEDFFLECVILIYCKDQTSEFTSRNASPKRSSNPAGLANVCKHSFPKTNRRFVRVMGHRVKTGAYMVETPDFDLFWTPVVVKKRLTPVPREVFQPATSKAAPALTKTFPSIG